MNSNGHKGQKPVLDRDFIRLKKEMTETMIMSLVFAFSVCLCVCVSVCVSVCSRPVGHSVWPRGLIFGIIDPSCFDLHNN